MTAFFTGLNNLKIISILDEKYDEHFGFTDEEVQKICDDYQMSQKFETMKEWYNGYLFGNANVYNPWSVIQFMDDLQDNSNCFPKAYWANTSSNSIVRKLIELADEDTRTEIEELIEGKTIEKPIHEDITYDEVYNKLDNLWNFMFFTGYFRKVSERMDAYLYGGISHGMVIAGHTPTIAEKELPFNHGNVYRFYDAQKDCVFYDIDCGCSYAGIRENAKLACIRLEDEKIFYA